MSDSDVQVWARVAVAAMLVRVRKAVLAEWLRMAAEVRP